MQSPSYYTTDSLKDYFDLELSVVTETVFPVLSLNCQSLNAKFDKLYVFLETLEQFNFQFSAICLLETRIDDNTDLSPFQLPGYTCISQGHHCSKHGGLMIDLLIKYNYSVKSWINHNDTYEIQSINIENSSPNSRSINLFNIYRPPKENNCNSTVIHFINEIEPVLSDLNQSKAYIIICGDFNIDLLQINERDVFKEYLDLLVINRLLPNITFPTRIGTTRASLIDNIFTNIPMSHMQCSGIFVTDISDHLPCFSVFKFNHVHQKYVNKYMYRRQYSDESINSFLYDISSKNILGSFDVSLDGNPDKNYDILDSILQLALNRHMPLRKFKYNKHKHKKSNWITAGIIRSIKFRNNLYKCLKQTSQDAPDYLAKLNLKTYNTLLKKLIRNAKAKFFHSQFEKHKYNTKNTWKTINKILNKSEAARLPDYITVSEINLTDKSDTAKHFNTYFGNIGKNMSESFTDNSNIHFSSYLDNVSDL